MVELNSSNTAIKSKHVEGEEVKMRSFTIIELLIVVVIIAILAAIAIPAYQNLIATQNMNIAASNLMEEWLAMQVELAQTTSFNKNTCNRVYALADSLNTCSMADMNALESIFIDNAYADEDEERGIGERRGGEEERERERERGADRERVEGRERRFRANTGQEVECGRNPNLRGRRDVRDDVIAVAIVEEGGTFSGSINDIPKHFRKMGRNYGMFIRCNGKVYTIDEDNNERVWPWA